MTDAELGQGDHVHITLDHKQAFGVSLGLPRLVQSVQFTPLVEYWRLR